MNCGIIIIHYCCADNYIFSCRNGIEAIKNFLSVSDLTTSLAEIKNCYLMEVAVLKKNKECLQEVTIAIVIIARTLC